MALKTLQNFFKTTISTVWATGTGNRYIATLPSASTGRLVINPANSTKREIIEYSAKGTDGGGNYITVSVRGVGGTTEQTHDIGEAVRSNITAEVITDIQTELDLKLDDTQLDTDGTLAANSDTKLASQKATKTYADTKLPASYLDTDATMAANSDVKVPSQKATKAYALPKTGGTMTGALILSTSSPSTALEAASKGYVDDGILQGAADASTSVKGIGRISVAPVSPTDPIFVGDNDPRVGLDPTPVGIISPYTGRVAPTDWLICDGSAVSRTTYADLFAVLAPTGVFTVTIATPAVFTKVAHTLVEGDIVHFTTTGALPTGLATNTDYYVISAGLTANAFRVSTTRGGAAVNTTGSQSGVHTFFATNYGKGDGSTTFNLPNLKGKTVYGYDAADDNFDVMNTPNTYVGAKTHTLDLTQIPAHTHTYLTPGGTGGSPQSGTVSAVGVSQNSGSSGGGLAHNNMPPYMVLNYIIKY